MTPGGIWEERTSVEKMPPPSDCPAVKSEAYSRLMILGCRPLGEASCKAPQLVIHTLIVIPFKDQRQFLYSIQKLQWIELPRWAPKGHGTPSLSSHVTLSRRSQWHWEGGTQFLNPVSTAPYSVKIAHPEQVKSSTVCVLDECNFMISLKQYDSDASPKSRDKL